MTEIQNSKQYYVLIDESGTLPDPRDKFVVIAAVGLHGVNDGRNLISRILNSLRQRKIIIKEVKFYYAGEQTKRQILSAIVLSGLEIFITIIDKKRRNIVDTPENFALLVAELINEINLWRQGNKLEIMIDRHFHKKDDEVSFNKFLQINIKKNSKYAIRHIDSQRNFIINLADFAAGAVLSKYNKNNHQFYDIIKENILLEKIINWPELKRKSLGK